MMLARPAPSRFAGHRPTVRPQCRIITCRADLVDASDQACQRALLCAKKRPPNSNERFSVPKFEVLDGPPEVPIFRTSSATATFPSDRPCCYCPLRSKSLVGTAIYFLRMGASLASRARRKARSLAVFSRSAHARCSYSAAGACPSTNGCCCLKRSSAFCRRVIKLSLALRARVQTPRN